MSSTLATRIAAAMGLLWENAAKHLKTLPLLLSGLC